MTKRTSSAGLQRISPLATDDDLARGIPAAELRAAIDATTVPMLRADPGPWTPPPPLPGDDFLGFLLIDGLLARHVLITGVGCTELLGPGDFMRPWDQAEGVASVPFDVDWEVLEPTSIAVLDERVTRAIGRWPVIAVGLSSKTIRRTQSLAVHLAITCLVGVDARLHVLLWHLADRFGRTTADGVVVALPLTHKTLARLVRSSRPAVTSALGRLAERGVVVRRDDGSFLLHGKAPALPLDDVRDVDARATVQ